MNRSLKYRIASGMGVLLMAGAVFVASPMSASAKKAPKPKMTVTPKTNLSNGQTVQVAGTGFQAGDGIFIVECVTKDQSLTGSGCDTNNPVPVTVGPNGAWGPVSFQVITGSIGTDGGTCGTSKKDAKKCSVSAGNPSGGDKKQVAIKFVVPS